MQHAKGIEGRFVIKALIVFLALIINCGTANAVGGPLFKKSGLSAGDLIKSLRSKRPEVRLENMWYSKFKGKSFYHSTFWKNKMPQADLQGTYFNKAKFKDTTLPSSDLGGASINFSSFDNVAMPNSKFTDSSFLRSTISKSDISGSDFSGTYSHQLTLDNVILEKTIFNEVVAARGLIILLSNAELAQFTYSHFFNSIFYKTNMRGTNWRGSTIMGAIFKYVDLRGSDLTNTKMSNVYFYDTDLRGAKLEGITGENIYYTKGTQFPEGFSPENTGMTMLTPKMEEFTRDLMRDVIKDVQAGKEVDVEKRVINELDVEEKRVRNEFNRKSIIDLFYESEKKIGVEKRMVNELDNKSLSEATTSTQEKKVINELDNESLAEATTSTPEKQAINELDNKSLSEATTSTQEKKVINELDVEEKRVRNAFNRKSIIDLFYESHSEKKVDVEKRMEDKKLISALDRLIDVSLPSLGELRAPKIKETTRDLMRSLIKDAQAGKKVNIEERVINALYVLIDESLPPGEKLTPKTRKLYKPFLEYYIKDTQAGENISVEKKVMNALLVLAEEQHSKGVIVTPKMKKATQDIMTDLMSIKEAFINALKSTPEGGATLN